MMLFYACTILFTVMCESLPLKQQYTPNVGTVLFSGHDIRRKQWGKNEMGLLQARRYFQNILPPPVFINGFNEEHVSILLRYFRDAYAAIKKEAKDPETDTIMTTALSDAVGGYFKVWVLPIAKFDYYGGTISQANVIKLFRFYNEIKRYLDTNGDGWRKPDERILNSMRINVAPLQFMSNTRSMRDPCDRLAYFEKTPTGLSIPIPNVNWNNKSSTMFVPLKNVSLIMMNTPDASHNLMKYYDAARSCIQSSNPKDQQYFDEKFQKWLIDEVIPHLKDENLYLALGSVLTLVNKTQKLCNNVINNYQEKLKAKNFSNCKCVSTMEISNKKMWIIIIILLIEVAWCVPALICIMCSKKLKKKDCSSNIYLFIDNEKKQSKGGGRTMCAEEDACCMPCIEDTSHVETVVTKTCPQSYHSNTEFTGQYPSCTTNNIGTACLSCTGCNEMKCCALTQSKHQARDLSKKSSLKKSSEICEQRKNCSTQILSSHDTLKSNLGGASYATMKSNSLPLENLQKIKNKSNECTMKYTSHEDRKNSDHRRKSNERRQSENNRKCEIRKHDEGSRKSLQYSSSRDCKKFEEHIEAEEHKKLEERRQTEECRKLEERRRAEECRKYEDLRRAEKSSKLEERKRAEECKKFEGLRQAEDCWKLEEHRRTDECSKLEEHRPIEELKKYKHREQTEECRKPTQCYSYEECKKPTQSYSIEECKKPAQCYSFEENKMLDDNRQAEECKKLEELRQAEECRKLEELRQAEECRKFEELRQADECRKLNERKQAEECKKLQERRQIEESRILEDRRLAEECRKLEELRQAEECKKLEERRLVEKSRILEELSQAGEYRKLKERKPAEECKKLDERRQIEECKKLEELKKLEECRKLRQLDECRNTDDNFYPNEYGQFNEQRQLDEFEKLNELRKRDECRKLQDRRKLDEYKIYKKTEFNKNLEELGELEESIIDEFKEFDESIITSDSREFKECGEFDESNKQAEFLKRYNDLSLVNEIQYGNLVETVREDDENDDYNDTMCCGRPVDPLENRTPSQICPCPDCIGSRTSIFTKLTHYKVTSECLPSHTIAKDRRSPSKKQGEAKTKGFQPNKGLKQKGSKGGSKFSFGKQPYVEITIDRPGTEICVDMTQCRTHTSARPSKIPKPACHVHPTSSFSSGKQGSCSSHVEKHKSLIPQRKKKTADDMDLTPSRSLEQSKLNVSF